MLHFRMKFFGKKAMKKIFFSLLMVIFVLYCFVKIRSKDEREIVAFVIDSIEGMMEPETFEDRLFGIQRHGETVRSILCSNGKPDELFFYSVDNFSGGINRKEYINTLRHILGYAKKYPSHKVVVNMSFGGYKHDENEQKIIKELAGSGVIMVAAAGNDGEERVEYPAAFEEVIAVASAHKGYKCSYSNYGPEIDIAAHGNFRTSEQVTLPTDTGFSTITRKITVSGTSFAAPRVAGTIVNVLRNSRDKDIDVKGIIKETAKSMNDVHYSRKKMGAGVLSRFSATRRVAPNFWLSEFPGISIPFILGMASMLIVIAWIRDNVCDYSHERLESWPLSGRFWGTLLGAFIIIWTIKYADLFLFRGWGIRLTAGPIIALGLVPALVGYVLKHAGYAYTLAVVQAASEKKDTRSLAMEMLKCRKVSDIQSKVLNGLVSCGRDAYSFLGDWLMSTRLNVLTQDMEATLREYNKRCGLSRLFVNIIFSETDAGRPVFRDRTSPWAMLNSIVRDRAYDKKSKAAAALKFVTYPGDPHSKHLLHRAVQERRLDVLNLLMGKFSVNEKDENGQTPLHIAATVGDKKIFLKLSQLKCMNITAKDKNGHTPVDLIWIHGHLDEFADLLEEYGNKG